MVAPNTYIVIVNYNSGTRLIPCLRSIFNAKKDLRHDHVIIVDNASRDRSRDVCKGQYPRLSYIFNSANIGFGAGANIGIRHALEKGAKNIILINPDAIIDPMCLEHLEKALTGSDVGIVSPVVYTLTQNPRVWFSGGIIDYVRQRVVHTTDTPMPSSTRPTPFISGCVMGFNAACAHKIGLFDERFFLYYEDADLSRRATDAGLTNMVIADARAHHEEQSESMGEQKVYYLVLSGLLFFSKHTPLYLRPWFHVFVRIRRVKNIFNMARKKPLSGTIRNALRDYATAKHSTHFVSDRKL